MCSLQGLGVCALPFIQEDFEYRNKARWQMKNEECLGCDEHECMECCPHDEWDHDQCMDCGKERCPGEAIDRAMDYGADR